MTDRDKIIKTHSDEHDRLTKLYYKDKGLSKEAFDQLHGANWDSLMVDLLAYDLEHSEG